METKVNFAVVGAFVLVLSAAAVAAVLYFGSGRAYREDHDTYLALFRESVSGLNVNAPVKYRGVTVGSVREIGLDPRNPEQVRLVLSIARGTPIKKDTVAVLSTQGLTGIAFVDLGGGSRESPPLEKDPERGYPVIPTGPSLLRRLDTAASSLLADLDQTARRLNSVLDDPTLRSFRHSVRDLEKLMGTMAGRAQVIDAGIVNAGRTLESTARASAELADLVSRLGRAAAAVEKMAGELAGAGAAARETFEGVRRSARAAGSGVEHFSTESLPEIDRLVAEMRALTGSLGRISRSLERDPSALLLGREPPPPGPGE